MERALKSAFEILTSIVLRTLGAVSDRRLDGAGAVKVDYAKNDMQKSYRWENGPTHTLDNAQDRWKMVPEHHLINESDRPDQHTWTGYHNSRNS